MPESKTLSSAILKDRFLFRIRILLIWQSARFPPNYCSIQDAMVSNLGCAPDAVPQWESGRIAFLKFLPFGIGSYRDWCGEARYFRVRKEGVIRCTHPLNHHFQGRGVRNSGGMTFLKRSAMAAFYFLT